MKIKNKKLKNGSVEQ